MTIVVSFAPYLAAKRKADEANVARRSATKLNSFFANIIRRACEQKLVTARPQPLLLPHHKDSPIQG